MVKKKVTHTLMLLLAIMAATIATGLVAGFSMWPWIVAYWITLTMKNMFDVGVDDGSEAERLSKTG